jgi:hypothetical protein
MAKFKNPEEMTRQQLTKAFASGKKDEICDALIAMAFYDEDWKWSQTQCLHFLSHSDPDVRGVAASCLGHIARIHHQLDQEIVESTLKQHLQDKLIAARVQDALDDIEFFLGQE